MISFCEFVRLIEAKPVISKHPPYTLSSRNRSVVYPILGRRRIRGSEIAQMTQYDAEDAKIRQEIVEERELLLSLFNQLPAKLQQEINTARRYNFWAVLLRSSNKYNLERSNKYNLEGAIDAANEVISRLGQMSDWERF